jgi:hypothetical protein
MKNPTYMKERRKRRTRRRRRRISLTFSPKHPPTFSPVSTSTFCSSVLSVQETASYVINKPGVAEVFLQTPL